jgi:Protein of unknown function (DUF2958)
LEGKTIMTTQRTRPDPAHDDAHDLMPQWLEDELPALYATERTDDPMVQCKFFTPDSSWTWYVTEYSPLERMCFGLVDGLDKELGYFSLNELLAARGHLGLQVERDLWFTPCPLSKVQGT